MPVLPLVGSSSSRPGSSSPLRSAASTMATATLSLIEPVGFCPSSFAYRRTDGFGLRRGSSTSGVSPTSSRSPEAVSVLATAQGLSPGHGASGHGRKQNDLRPLVHGRVQALPGADV